MVYTFLLIRVLVTRCDIREIAFAKTYWDWLNLGGNLVELAWSISIPCTFHQQFCLADMQWRSFRRISSPCIMRYCIQEIYSYNMHFSNVLFSFFSISAGFCWFAIPGRFCSTWKHNLILALLLRAFVQKWSTLGESTTPPHIPMGGLIKSFI